MRARLISSALLLSVAVLAGDTVVSPAAAGPAQSYQYRHTSFRNACRAPLKFAAGACVRQCPAGYRDTGRGTCSFRSMRR